MFFKIIPYDRRYSDAPPDNFLCNFNIPFNSKYVNDKIITILQAINDYFVYYALKTPGFVPKAQKTAPKNTLGAV